jgi:hypothetical protein
MCNHFLYFDDLLNFFHQISQLIDVLQLEGLYHNLLTSPKSLNKIIRMNDKKGLIKHYNQSF